MRISDWSSDVCSSDLRGQISGGILDGPLAFDNAISEAAAREKGIVSPVAGKAEVLVVPNLEAGNMLAKQLTFLGGADAAGVVLGARVPIILTSRADSERTRLRSEEHTSELQSLMRISYAVFCLKKKKTTQT